VQDIRRVDGSGASLPFVLDTLKGADAVALARWLRERESEAHSALAESGAILFRETGVRTPQEFEQVCRALTPDLTAYTGGGSPRTRVDGHVYTSTEYAAQLHIPLHCEATYLSRVPKRVWFFCQTPPAAQGETPLGDMRRVRARLPVALVEQFRSRGLLYQMNLSDGRGFGKSWQTTYETNDRAVVEKLLTADGLEFEWHDDGGLRVCMRQPALRPHSRTGEEIWTNQAVNWHPAHLGGEHVQRMQRVFGDERRFPKAVFYGDGGAIAVEDIECVAAALAAEETTFDWRRGDILLVDNEVIAHGRRPFTGERVIHVALA
jgi:alpha-ketoglutarate-dependent taurine dioxygenase